MNEEYGKNDFGYPDPTQAKQKNQKTGKKTATKGEHKPLDKATDYEELEGSKEFDNEDTRIDFDKTEPKKMSQATKIGPPKKLPKLPKEPKP